MVIYPFFFGEGVCEGRVGWGKFVTGALRLLGDRSQECREFAGWRCGARCLQLRVDERTAQTLWVSLRLCGGGRKGGGGFVEGVGMGMLFLSLTSFAFVVGVSRCAGLLGFEPCWLVWSIGFGLLFFSPFVALSSFGWCAYRLGWEMQCRGFLCVFGFFGFEGYLCCCCCCCLWVCSK